MLKSIVSCKDWDGANEHEKHSRDKSGALLISKTFFKWKCGPTFLRALPVKAARTRTCVGTRSLPGPSRVFNGGGAAQVKVGGVYEENCDACVVHDWSFCSDGGKPGCFWLLSCCFFCPCCLESLSLTASRFCCKFHPESLTPRAWRRGIQKMCCHFSWESRSQMAENGVHLVCGLTSLLMFSKLLPARKGPLAGWSVTVGSLVQADAALHLSPRGRCRVASGHVEELT